MREMVGLMMCLWFLLYGSCTCGFRVEQSGLEVISPESLKGVYKYSFGNFGGPEHGGSIVGTVVYPKTNRKACRSFDEVNISFKRRPGDLPVILLADRGDCFFTLKAWKAQSAGAAAILIVDDKIEPLITMDTPEEDPEGVEYLRNLNISIPSALTGKVFGDNVKTMLNRGEMVVINLDWKEAFPHHDEQLEFEFWTQAIIDGTQTEFIKNFKGVAQILEQRGYTKFTPHYITWNCPEAFILSKQCRSHCIYRGRYCALEPKQGFRMGYGGKDVVIENLRQACFFKSADEIGKPWLWWDYVTDFAIHCSMKDNKYNKRCGDQIIQSLGIDLEKIDKCIGDPNADVPNPVLQTEQEAQIGKGSRGDVTISPTLIINSKHYRGKLDKGAVLEAICSGFQETSKPAICSFEGIETNVYFNNNGGYWQTGSLEMKDG